MIPGMTEESKEQPTSSESRERRAQGHVRFVGTCVLLAMFVFTLPSMILFCFGMIPTMVAYLIDPFRSKYCARSVGMLNLAGVVPFLMKLWSENNTVSGVMDLLADPFSWLVMFGAAAMGWLIYLGVPTLVSVYKVIRAEQTIGVLKERQKELMEEWGEKVSGIKTQKPEDGQAEE
jgi:hypothetical protein